MATISGKNGVVLAGGTAMLNVNGWTLNHSVATDAYGSNNTGGWKARVSGTKDWNARVRAKYDATIVPVVGSSYALTLSIDGSDNATGNAICQGFELEVDIDTGKAVAYDMTFEGNGALTLPS